MATTNLPALAPLCHRLALPMATFMLHIGVTGPFGHNYMAHTEAIKNGSFE